jgi:hypothetical protein
MSLKVSILESASHEMDDYTPHEKRHHHFHTRKRYSAPALAIAAALGFFVCYLLEATFQTTPLVRSSFSLPQSNRLTAISDLGPAFTRPKDAKVIGLMFYGRAQFVNVLEASGSHQEDIAFVNTTSATSEEIFEKMADGKLFRSVTTKHP